MKIIGGINHKIICENTTFLLRYLILMGLKLYG